MRAMKHMLPALATLLAAAAVIGAPCLAQAQSRGEIESVVKEYLATHPEDVQQIVKDYLAKNPDVLEDAINDFVQRRAAGGGSADKVAAVKANAAKLFSSPRPVNLGNPQGDVTMVEFFDYNCGFCKRALSDMVDLLKAEPNLKVVLKEFPVLGPGSVEAARIAVAVRMQDPSGKKYLEFHRKLLGGRGQANKAQALAAARDAGLDVARLEKDSLSDEARETLDENMGAVGIAELNDKIKAARK
jgi:protein-disulfide isomerase